MLRIALRVRLRAAHAPSSAQDDTRGIHYLPEGSKKHLWKSLAISAFALLLSLVLQSLIKAYEAGRGLQICNPFFDVQIARRILYRGKHHIIVVEISQISVTERFCTALGNIGLIDFYSIDKQGRM